MGRLSDRAKPRYLARLQHVFEVKLPPIPETKRDSYALALQRALNGVRFWKFAAAATLIAGYVLKAVVANGH